MAAKTYEIGGKKYVQNPLVFGQWQDLTRTIAGMAIPRTTDPGEIVAAFGAVGDKLPQALAVVLTEEGKSIRGKDLKAIGEELAYAMSPEQVCEVVEDFFICNPIALISQRLKGAAATIRERLPQKATGSKSSSASSPEETLPDDQKSCGDSLP